MKVSCLIKDDTCTIVQLDLIFCGTGGALLSEKIEVENMLRTRQSQAEMANS